MTNNELRQLQALSITLVDVLRAKYLIDAQHNLYHVNGAGEAQPAMVMDLMNTISAASSLAADLDERIQAEKPVSRKNTSEEEGNE